MFRVFAIGLVVSLAGYEGSYSASSAKPQVTGASRNRASPNSVNDKDPSLIAKAEVLLDRAHFSPSAIDGLDGDNFRNAVRAFQEVSNIAVTGSLDADTWKAITSKDAAPVLKAYTISDADVSAPFTKVIPTILEQMAKLPGLSHTSPQAELAERFHMARSLLRRLNPLADFERAGTEIVVADVMEMNLRPGRQTVEAVPAKSDKDLDSPVAPAPVSVSQEGWPEIGRQPP